MPPSHPFARARPQEAALTKALDALEAHVAAGGPFVGGDSVGATDCSLMPKLYHLQARCSVADFSGLPRLTGEGVEWLQCELWQRSVEHGPWESPRWVLSC